MSLFFSFSFSGAPSPLPSLALSLAIILSHSIILSHIFNNNVDRFLVWLSMCLTWCSLSANSNQAD